MLTLVAAVLAYDLALDTCDLRSSRSLSLYVRSDTKEEKDMTSSDETGTDVVDV